MFDITLYFRRGQNNTIESGTVLILVMQGPTATLVEQGTELDLVCWFLFPCGIYPLLVTLIPERKEILNVHVQQVQAQQILLYMVLVIRK